MILYPKKNRDCIFVKGQLLTIGKLIDFTISKIVFIGDTDYFIFTDNSGDHFFVPRNYYLSYNFQIGQQIQGWVDKINCLGRIFIEPNHPVYKIGEHYDFKVLHFKYSNDSIIDKKIIYFVQDVFGNEREVIATVKPQIIPLSITCNVEKIKKGQIYLSVV